MPPIAVDNSQFHNEKIRARTEITFSRSQTHDKNIDQSYAGGNKDDSTREVSLKQEYSSSVITDNN